MICEKVNMYLRGILGNRLRGLNSDEAGWAFTKMPPVAKNLYFFATGEKQAGNGSALSFISTINQNNRTRRFRNWSILKKT